MNLQSMKRQAVPLHAEVAAVLRHQIKSGELLPGTKLPALRELTEQLGVARMTVVHAMNALYVRADSPYNTFEEFIKGAKENKLTIGVNNLGAPPNLSAVQMATEFGLEFKTLALKTVPATMAGLVGGQVDVAVGQVAYAHACKDEVRPLIILDNNRREFFEKDLPGVRTVGEAFPGMEAGAWVHGGLAVKAGTPQEVIDKLLAASEILGTEDFRARLPKSVGYHWVHGSDGVLALI